MFRPIAVGSVQYFGLRYHGDGQHRVAALGVRRTQGALRDAVRGRRDECREPRPGRSSADALSGADGGVHREEHSEGFTHLRAAEFPCRARRDRPHAPRCHEHGAEGRRHRGRAQPPGRGDADRTGLDQGADRRAPQGTDPVQPRRVDFLPDARLGEHAPVAHQDDLRQPEALTQLLDLRPHRGRISGITRKDLDRHRTAGGITEQAELNLQRASRPVPRGVARGQGTGGALHVHRGQVIEHQGTVGQVALRQRPLDAVLALEQPVHGTVQVIFIHRTQLEAVGQAAGGGGLGQAAGGGGLGQAAGGGGLGQSPGGGQRGLCPL